MTIKVKIGQPSARQNLKVVARGEKKPVIVPDSVTLGVDTVGNYVATIDAGAGILITPNTHIETAQITISHKDTSSVANTSNDAFGFLRNIEVDQFGHIIGLGNLSIDSTYFISNNDIITPKSMTIGTTDLNLGETITSITGLVEVEVPTISNPSGAITLAPTGAAGNNVVNVSDSRIEGVNNPLFDKDAINKQYLEQELNSLSLTIKIFDDPVLPTDAANKRYVDNLAQGIVVRPSALAATTAHLAGTFDSGNSSIGATITLPAAATLNIDDVTSWSLGDNIVVKDQNNPRQNGSYDIVQVGNASTPWILRRAEWQDTSAAVPGSFEFVTDGTQNGGTSWVITVADAESFAIDVDDITWTQFAGEGTFTAGTGLTLNGTQFNVNQSQILETINTPNDILNIVGSGALKIPVGGTVDRPTAAQGQIRYNTTDGQFEGYDGVAWSGLGGVIDVDQDTKITAENSAGSDNDQLKFITGGTLAAMFDSANTAYFYGDVDIAGDVTIGGNITIGDQTTDSIQVVADFESNLIPNTNATYNLGAINKNWNKLFIGKLDSDNEIIDITTTGALKLPSANTSLRPTPTTGMIRFNTEDQRFEGYDGSAWGGLSGSVIDVDRNTYIVAETSAGANNNDLDFWTDGVHRLQIDQDGKFRFGQGLNKFTIDYATGNTTIAGTLNVDGIVTIAGNITIGDQDTDSINIVADFESHLIPNADSTYDLGSSTKHWRNLYVDTISNQDNIIDFDINGAIILPVGGTGARPTAQQGMIRYNTTDGQFEGYDGTAWAGLGGVIDVDQDTKILAENSPGADNDELKFLTAGTQRLIISSAGIVANTTISSNNNLVLDANNHISVSNNRIINVANPVDNSDAANKGYVANSITNISSTLTIEDAANTHYFELLQNPTIVLGRGLQALNEESSNNQIEIGVEISGVTPGIYGNDGYTPRVNIDATGRVTFATEIPVELQANAIPDFTETVHDLVGEMFRNNVEIGIRATSDDANDKIDLVITADYVESFNAGFGITIDHTPSTGSTANVSVNTTELDNRYAELSGATFTGDVIGPRFVDSDNTAYFLNPAGESRLQNIELGFGQNSSQIKMIGTNGTAYLYSNGRDIGFLDSGFNFGAFLNKTTGDWTVDNGDVKAERFVDADATSFFIHPGGTDSIIAGLRVTGDLEVGDISVSAGVISSNTGSFSVGTNRITNVGTPTAASDAANKSYVDNVVQGVIVRPSVLAATTGDLGATYNNGAGTLTLSANTTLDIDGVTDWVLGETLLVKDQLDAIQNGAYEVTTVGDANTAWVFTRSEYSDETPEIAGSFHFVTDGDTYRNTGWVATVTDAESFVLGVGDITWVQFSGAGSYSAGDGLTLTGTDFSVNVDDSTIEINTDTLRVKDAGITNAKLANPTFTVIDENGANTEITLGTSLTFTGVDGVDTTVTAGNIAIAVNELDGGTF